jgi:hypothetical protein
VIDDKTQVALSQIGREEKAAVADEVLSIARHRASMAQQKGGGFRRACHRAGRFGPDLLAQSILRASLQKDRIAAPQRNDAMGQKATSARLFDDLVSNREEGRRNF